MAVNKEKKSRKKNSAEYNSGGLRVNYLIIFVGGLVLLITGILIFLLIIKNVYGNYEINEIMPTAENLELVQKENKAGVLYSQYTENTLPEGSTWLSDNIDTWERFLKGADVNYEIISDQDIELGKHYGYEFLVLPGARSLSDKETVELKKYIEEGGSIFATGGTATFSDEAKWRGWEFVTEVFGMKFTKEIDPLVDKRKIHTLRGNLPLTAGIPTGYTLQIATWDRPIYMEILEPRTTQVSFWYDFRREAGLVMEQIKRSAGIAYGEYGQGRFVWYGFEINSVIGEQEDYINFERLFNNSVNWLTYSPTSNIMDWPEPYEAAAIFVPTLTDQIGNVRNLTGVIGDNRYPATFFVDPFVAIENPSVVRPLGQYGTIGARIDVGFLESAEDTLNKLFPKEEQFASLAFAKDTLEAITGADVKGLMPYYGFYDENTLQAMSEENFEFLITDSLTDRSVPKVTVRNNKTLMIITKTARDDYQIIRDYGLTNTNFQKFTYEEDIDRILFEGGLYVLKVHSNYQMRPQYVGVIRDVMKYIRNNNMWLCSIEDLRSWWLRRGGVEIMYETRSKRRIAVEVSNPQDTRVYDLVVKVNLNKKVKDIEISSDIINTKLPRYEYNQSNNTLYLYIDYLDGGESRSFLIDFENVNA